MLKVAKELKKRQFLFITPNSIPIDSDDLVINGGPVEIQKLVKPKRMEWEVAGEVEKVGGEKRREGDETFLLSSTHNNKMKMKLKKNNTFTKRKK